VDEPTAQIFLTTISIAPNTRAQKQVGEGHGEPASRKHQAGKNAFTRLIGIVNAAKQL